MWSCTPGEVYSSCPNTCARQNNPCQCISWQKLPSCSHQRTLFSWLLNLWQRNRKPSSKSLSHIKFTTSAHLATFTLERAFWSFFKSAKHFPPPLGGTFPPWLSCFHPQRRNGSCSLPRFQCVRVMGPSLSRCFKMFLKLCCSNRPFAPYVIY